MKNFFKILRSPFLYNAYKEFFEFIEVVPRFATYSNPSLSTRVSIKSLSLSRVGATKLVARCRRGGGGGGRGIYAYIPGKLIQDQSRNNHRRRRPTSNFSLSLSLFHSQGFLGKRKEEGNRVCNLFRPTPLSLSTSLNSEEHRW